MYYVCINSQYLCMNVFIPWYFGITADDTVGAECTVSEKVGLGLLTFITQRAHNVLLSILKGLSVYYVSTSDWIFIRHKLLNEPLLPSVSVCKHSE